MRESKIIDLIKKEIEERKKIYKESPNYEQYNKGYIAGLQTILMKIYEETIENE